MAAIAESVVGRGSSWCWCTAGVCCTGVQLAIRGLTLTSAPCLQHPADRDNTERTTPLCILPFSEVLFLKQIVFWNTAAQRTKTLEWQAKLNVKYNNRPGLWTERCWIPCVFNIFNAPIQAPRESISPTEASRVQGKNKNKGNCSCEQSILTLPHIKTAWKLASLAVYWLDKARTEVLLHLSESTQLPLPAVKSQVVVKYVHARRLCVPYSNNLCTAQVSRCTHTRLPMDYGAASAHFNTELLWSNKSPYVSNLWKTANSKYFTHLTKKRSACTNTHWSQLCSCNA